MKFKRRTIIREYNIAITLIFINLERDGIYIFVQIQNLRNMRICVTEKTSKGMPNYKSQKRENDSASNRVML